VPQVRASCWALTWDQFPYSQLKKFFHLLDNLEINVISRRLDSWRFARLPHLSRFVRPWAENSTGVPKAQRLDAEHRADPPCPGSMAAQGRTRPLT
jgi:hypothetical protein